MSDIKKNAVFEAEIVDMTAEGNGVAKIDRFPVFVPRTAVGDRGKIRIVKVLKTYAYGILEELSAPSPARVENDCPAFPKCGGCLFRHVSYEEELRYKRKFVADALRRIGGFDLRPEPVQSGESARYRNKAQYPVGVRDEVPVTGFYEARSHRLVKVEDCRLTPPEFSDLTAAVADWARRNKVPVYDEATGTGLLRHLFVRKGFRTGETLLCLVINGRGIPAEKDLIETVTRVCPLQGVVLNFNTRRTNVILGDEERVLWGRGFIRDRLCGLEYEIAPRSFYQVNSAMTERLYAKVKELAEPRGKKILDLYCGIGSIGLSLADEAERIVGVEIVAAAVENARANARRAGIANAEFFLADAEQAADSLAESGFRPDVVLLDPPRKGCGETLPGIVARRFAPEKIVYVSCEPTTLARDLRRFADLGYEPRVAVPFDLFPRTGHVECVVLITRV